jgi:adenylate kinase
VNLILLGAPGSGKGTQSAMLKEKIGVPSISTGDILRAAVKSQTKLGIQAKEFMKAGKLVPDEVVIGIIEDRLKDADCKNGYILDGFPRTITQAEALNDMLSKKGSAIGKVVNLDVDDQELIERLSGRRLCRDCGASYHVTFSPSKKGDRCERCEGELYQREDDEEATIKKRLKVYKEQTQPLIDFYKKKNVLKNIAGVGDTQEIFTRIVTAIQS